MAHQEVSKERVELAIKKAHFEEAFKLVYREYLKKGYCSPNPSGMRISLYSALPETTTFCLWRQDTILATASLIIDSPMGLPVESTYPTEIKELRQKGRKLSEVSLLALNSDLISKGIKPLYFAERLRRLYHLFKPIFWYAKKTVGMTDLCIAVNPVHKMLYSSLYFEQFGDEKVYESVNRNPSVAMRLNFDRIEQRAQNKTPGLYKLFLGTPLEIKKITEVFRWNVIDFSYFFGENSDVLSKAKTEQIEYLTQLYPDFPIKELASEINSKLNHGQSILRKYS